jgi:antitoxin (DNA-binding transcriptional repressor) of toxin-antitoxin stability system
MTTLTVGSLKSHFSEVLTQVQNGQEIAVTYGRSKKKVAVILPYQTYVKKRPRKLGILQGKSSFTMSSDFKMGDTEFLNS